MYYTDTRVATKIDSYVDKAFIDNLSVVAASATGNAGSATVLANARTIAGVSFDGSANISLDTSNITEDSSYLYYTDSRANSAIDTRVNKAFVDALNVVAASATGNAGSATVLANARTIAGVSFDGSANITLDTADITEDSSALYFTNARARSAISVSGSLAYNSSTGVLSFTQRTDAEVQALITAGTGVSVSSGAVSIGQAVATSDSPTFSNMTLNGTGSIKVPSGTTGQRDGSPANGMFRYNTTDAQFEGYADGAWGAIAGSGGASAMETNNFTGDGSTAAFTLSSTVSDEDNLLAFIEGVYQNKADFVASGTTITFDTAPASGRNIVVHHVKSNISGSNVILNSFTGDGSDTTFTLSTAPQSENNTQVYLNGVYQNKSTYSVSGTTLTFDAAPANTVAIEVMMFTQTTVNQPTANSVGITQLNVSDGSNGQVLTTNGSGTLSFSTVSGTTINNNANNRIITGSGTANTLEGEATLLFDGTTLGINAGTPTTNFSPEAQLQIGEAGTGTRSHLQLSTATNGYPAIHFGDGSGAAAYRGWVTYAHPDDAMTFGTTATERMRIDSAGKVGIGTNSPTHQLDVEITSTNTPTARFLNKGAITGYTNICAIDTYQSASVNHQFLVMSSGNGSAISDNEFNFRGDGNAFADGSFSGGGADYAEYFEWEDGNTNNEDRVGHSVALINNKIKIAEDGDTIIGVISGNPSVVGDDAWNSWTNKYLKDDFGRYVLDEDGFRTPNPDYDDTLTYVNREDRKEWDVVGLMGKLRIKKGQQTNPSWIKMRDISDSVEEWLVK